MNTRRSRAPSRPAKIRFDATVEKLEGATILRLPEQASRALPSRGQVAVHGTIDGRPFETVIEPDGFSGHWMKVDAKLQKALGVKAGDTLALALEPSEQWPEPEVPKDLQAALATAPERIQSLWTQLTPMSRWEWVRWINATRNVDTRQRRIEVSISKLKSGTRRPCCFDRSACTDPDLSKSGKLMEPR